MDSHCGERIAFADDLHRAVCKGNIGKATKGARSGFICLQGPICFVRHKFAIYCHTPTAALEVLRECRTKQNGFSWDKVDIRDDISWFLEGQPALQPQETRFNIGILAFSSQGVTKSTCILFGIYYASPIVSTLFTSTETGVPSTSGSFFQQSIIKLRVETTYIALEHNINGSSWRWRDSFTTHECSRCRLGCDGLGRYHG